MRAFFSFLLLVLFVTFPFSAYAEPKCGEVEEDYVEDTFRAMERIDHYFDIEDELEAICEGAETLDDWERDQPRGTLDKVYKKKRKELIKDMEQEFQGLTDSLTALRAWIYYDPKGTINEAKRIGRLRSSKRDVEESIANLQEHVKTMQGFMKDIHSEE